MQKTSAYRSLIHALIQTCDLNSIWTTFRASINTFQPFRFDNSNALWYNEALPLRTIKLNKHSSSERQGFIYLKNNNKTTRTHHKTLSAPCFFFFTKCLFTRYTKTIISVKYNIHTKSFSSTDSKYNAYYKECYKIQLNNFTTKWNSLPITSSCKHTHTHAQKHTNFKFVRTGR